MVLVELGVKENVKGRRIHIKGKKDLFYLERVNESRKSLVELIKYWIFAL